MQTTEGIARTLTNDVARGRLAPGEALPSVRALAVRLGCAPGTVAGAYAALRSAGIVEGVPRARLRVAVTGAAVARRGPTGPLRLAGSDDPALDLVLRRVGDDVQLVPGRRGSVSGLADLARGAADAATLHLFHAQTHAHNDAFVRGLAGTEPLTVVHLWRREQGLVLAPGNPLRIASAADLAGRRIAWRDAGTGSRLLLERLLAEAGLGTFPGPGVVADSHRGVAIAVASGAADAGLAVRCAATAVGAHWLPLEVEPFELVLPDAALAAAGPLLAAIDDPDVQAAVEALGGYDLTDTGRTRSVP